MPAFLSIPDWSKFRAHKDHMRVSTHPEDDYPNWHELSFFEQALLQGIWRVAARTGRWCPNDLVYIRRALGMSGPEAVHLSGALSELTRSGFLVLCNEQNIPEIKKVLAMKPNLQAPKRKPSPVKKFTRPTVEEVAGYMQEQQMDPARAQGFVDFYASKGWVVGKSPMKDWKAAVRTWKRKDAQEKVFNLD